MIRVLMIAYYFPPAGGAGVQRTQKFVQHLPAEDILPIVLTGPTSPENHWTPQDLSLLASIPRNVAVHRVSTEPPHDSGKLRSRFERWLLRPSPFSKWWIRSATELGLGLAQDVDLIYATMSPFQSAEIATELSARTGVPWVADLRDPWALDEMQVYLTRLHRLIDLRKMKDLLSSAALIIMNTPEATSVLKKALPEIHPDRILTITNGFDEADFARPVHPRADGKFRIVHSGYLHTEAGLELLSRRIYRWLGGTVDGVEILTRSHTFLIRALERWCSNHTDRLKDLEVVFAGKATEGDQRIALESAILPATSFPGYLSHASSVELIWTADLLFLPMHNLPSGTRSRIVPGKSYEYMAADREVQSAYTQVKRANHIIIDGVTWQNFARCSSSDHTECLQVEPADDVVVRNSIFKNCDTIAVNFANDLANSNSAAGYRAPNNIVVENNFFDAAKDNTGGPTYYALNIRECTNCTIRYNSWLQAPRMPTGEISMNNVYEGNVGPMGSANCGIRGVTYRYNVWTDAKCSTTDKQAPSGFANPSAMDLHLAASSAAIGSGNPSSYPSRDIDGQLRSGDLIDAGADQRTASTASSSPVAPTNLTVTIR